MKVGLDLLAAIGEHANSRSTMRSSVVSPAPSAIDKSRHQIVVDAEAPRIFDDDRHAHVVRQSRTVIRLREFSMPKRKVEGPAADPAS